MAHPYENAGILGASAANKIPSNIGSNFMLKGYQGSDYNMPRFANVSWEEQFINSLRNEQAGMTQRPDMHTGKWFSTDPGYAQGFTTQAEVPIMRSIDYEVPVELTPPGQSKNFNQLINERAQVGLDFGTPYNKGSNLHNLVFRKDDLIDNYKNTNPIFYDETGNPQNFDSYKAPTSSEMKEWNAKEPGKIMTNLESKISDFNKAKKYDSPGFKSTSTAWPFAAQTPYGEFMYDKSWMGMGQDELMDIFDNQSEVDEFIKNRNNPVEHGKYIDAPDLHFTAAGQDALKHGRINYPLSIQAALGQHINNWTNKYYHRGEPNLDKAPLNTWKGIGQFFNTAKDITGAKAADTWQSLKANWSPKNYDWKSWTKNPVTQTLGKGAGFAGALGDVALGGMAYSDIMGGTNMVGNMTQDINKIARSPMDRQGRVIQNTGVYNNLKNVAQRDVNNPNEMRGATSFDTTRYNPREMNTGGLASLVL
mgnify:FL=1